MGMARLPRGVRRRYPRRRVLLTALIAVGVFGVGLLLWMTWRDGTNHLVCATSILSGLCRPSASTAVPAHVANHPIFAPRPSDRDGQWLEATLSQARTALAATTVGSKALFAGGCGAGAVATAGSRTCGAGGSVVDTVDIYDSSTDTWSAARLSVPRRDMAAASTGTKAFFAGGWTGTGEVSAVVDIYDAATGIWSTDVLVEPRRNLATTSVGTKVLFAGGFGVNVRSRQVDIYDTATGRWSSARLSLARSQLAATTVGDKAIFAGGMRSGRESAMVDIYDDATGTWSTARLSQARSNLGATSVGTLAFFAGGSSALLSQLSDTPIAATPALVDIYNDATGTWSTAALNQIGAIAATTIGESKALFVGGSSRSGDGRYYGPGRWVDIYDATTGTWRAQTLPHERQALVATAVGNRALLAGGQTPPSTPTTAPYSAVVHVYVLAE